LATFKLRARGPVRGRALIAVKVRAQRISAATQQRMRGDREAQGVPAAFTAA